MVSHLRSAKRAIEAEMSYAKQGAAYYLSRVEALEIALHQLESVDTSAKGGIKEAQRDTEHIRARKKTPHQAARRDAERGKKTSDRKYEVKPDKRKAAAAKITGTDSLPVTGRDFWFGLVGSQPQSAVDISNAAISALGIKPDQKTQIQKIKQRVAPALASLVATQKIRDSGSGRERRFFKAGADQ